MTTRRTNDPVMDGFKTCFKCAQTKHVTEFHPHKHQADGRLNKCRICTQGDVRQWRIDNPDKFLLQRRKRRLRIEYGMTWDQYVALSKSQGDQCLGCGKPQALTSTDALVVDHDHATGEVRGLLCSMCNLTLGNVNDKPATLRALADYLER